MFSWYLYKTRKYFRRLNLGVGVYYDVLLIVVYYDILCKSLFPVFLCVIGHKNYNLIIPFLYIYVIYNVYHSSVISISLIHFVDKQFFRFSEGILPVPKTFVSLFVSSFICFADCGCGLNGCLNR